MAILNVFPGIDAIGVVSSALAFVISAIFAGVLIPQILLISFRKKLFDIPDERKIHTSAVPRLGGIAFKPVVFFSIAFLLGVIKLLGYGDVLEGIIIERRILAFGYCAVLLVYLVGIADDLIGVRYSAKFFVQICCGLMVVCGGLSINNLYGILFIDEIPNWLGSMISVLLVVFIINAINLIDGIDGLASGLCGVATLFYGFVFLLMHEYLFSMLSFATLGVLVPFFYYNVFGDPEKQRKIFMGDTGSLTIGMIVCILSLRVMQFSPSDFNDTRVNPFIYAYIPMIIPCLDVIRVYFHRVRNGKNPFLPDKNHIHHKLLAVGMRQRTAMVTIICFSIGFILGNIILSHYVNVMLLLALDIFIWTWGNILLSRRIRKIKLKL